MFSLSEALGLISSTALVAPKSSSEKVMLVNYFCFGATLNSAQGLFLALDPEIIQSDAQDTEPESAMGQARALSTILSFWPTILFWGLTSL